MTGTDLVLPVLGGERVLVVETGEDSAASLTAVLRLHGFDAHEARTGTDALARTADRRPHVVLVDLDVSDIDGCALIRRLRMRPNPPAVVVLTAHTAGRVRRAAAEAGATAYLLKPADLDRLADLIRQLAGLASTA